MGYSTYFDGHFELDPPLTTSCIETIKALCDGALKTPGAPESDCPWGVTEDGRHLEPLNEEKVYGWDEWLGYLLDEVVGPTGSTASGRVVWQGENVGDCGVIFVRGNKMRIVHIQKMPEPCWDDV